MKNGTTPRQCLGKWLKEHTRSDQVHCILRFDNEFLVSYCGKVFPLAEAAEPVMGVRHCVVCTGQRNRQQQDRRKEPQNETRKHE